MPRARRVVVGICGGCHIPRGPTIAMTRARQSIGGRPQLVFTPASHTSRRAPATSLLSASCPSTPEQGSIGSDPNAGSDNAGGHPRRPARARAGRADSVGEASKGTARRPSSWRFRWSANQIGQGNMHERRAHDRLLGMVEQVRVVDDADARPDVIEAVARIGSPCRIADAEIHARPRVHADVAVAQAREGVLERLAVRTPRGAVGDHDARQRAPHAVIGKRHGLRQECRRVARLERRLGDEAAERLGRQRILACVRGTLGISVQGTTPSPRAPSTRAWG